MYPARLKVARAIQLMIMNNLDPRVAQYPHELVTYGGNGAVFSNWAQYHLVMKYLSIMNETQTLVMYSGHPAGLFPSSRSSPRVVITNGMVIPNYSTSLDLDRMYGLGVTMYGQMTAGSYCYIGPQGIVHGTTLTVLNAGRKYLGMSNLRGKVFVTSGLGGMSGAQGKAGIITGAITVIAEVSEVAIEKRFEQGWIQEKVNTLDECISLIQKYRKKQEPRSIAFHGNVVHLWEKLVEIHKRGVEEGNPQLLVELGSDQTSCHNVFNGGYYPVGLSFESANDLMRSDPDKFKEYVEESLKRQVAAINYLSENGLRFWDYGNSFLYEASRAGADVLKPDGKTFKYPSYVEDIMGDIFSLGFGPFRWVCTSGDPSDLDLTDTFAGNIVQELASNAELLNKQQYEDNLLWIRQAKEQGLVVGSQARILYSDAKGRIAIARAFNDLVKNKQLKGPVVISRDHHDVSGTDSPFRETSNIRDGSMFTADMAVQNFCGLGIHGATWVALHNGGGTGWGRAINGGFGLVLDGEDSTAEKLQDLLFWDVMNGVTRRAWSGNENAQWVVQQTAKMPESNYLPTEASRVDPSVIESIY
eukprot:TRINITY_DN3546_c0_g1_i21.p1 TRINITY_DN3546_c0_g1~~TRINITY_DN3546_c0_g1_i21.p1  ORF type:complete len:635 (+),score=116.16 TRINITY_DN3546_c0_g1_i21:150-1907(+)